MDTVFVTFVWYWQFFKRLFLVPCYLVFFVIHSLTPAHAANFCSSFCLIFPCLFKLVLWIKDSHISGRGFPWCRDKSVWVRWTSSHFKYIKKKDCWTALQCPKYCCEYVRAWMSACTSTIFAVFSVDFVASVTRPLFILHVQRNLLGTVTEYRTYTEKRNDRRFLQRKKSYHGKMWFKTTHLVWGECSELLLQQID